MDTLSDEELTEVYGAPDHLAQTRTALFYLCARAEDENAAICIEWAGEAKDEARVYLDFGLFTQEAGVYPRDHLEALAREVKWLVPTETGLMRARPKPVILDHGGW